MIHSTPNPHSYKRTESGLYTPKNQNEGVSELEDELSLQYQLLENQTNINFANQKKANINDIFPVDAILHYIDHPEDYVTDVFGIKLDKWQYEVCRALVEPGGGFVSVAAGSGVGKSFLLARLICWFLTTRKGKIPCTAPTVHQLYDILWSELKAALESAPDLQKIFTWTQTKFFVKGHVATWFAVARTATIKKDGKVQEGLQGFHADHLLFIVDEASGVEDSAMAAVDGALTAPNAMIIMTSNPTRLTGRFYTSFTKSCKALGGPWINFNIDCRDCQYVGNNYVTNMLLEHGEESPIFKAKVSGQFPESEENALVSLANIQIAFGEIEASSPLVELGDARELIFNLSRTEHPVYTSGVFCDKKTEQDVIGYLARRVGLRGLYDIGERLREAERQTKQSHPALAGKSDGESSISRLAIKRLSPAPNSASLN